MTKTGTGAIAIGLLVLLTGARARAQETPALFGEAHELVVSSERLFGFVYSSQKVSDPGGDTTTTVTTFSLFSNPVSFISLYATPRLALDGFVTDRFSVGLAAGFFTTSESESQPGLTVNTSSPTITGFSFAPRVGYALPLGRVASLWPRVGFTFFHLSTSDSSSASTSLYAATLEVPLVITVVPHFFVSVAPTLDLGLGGSTSAFGATGGSMSVDAKETDFGLECALGGFF
jgi:hypothetical protein